MFDSTELSVVLN